LKMNPITLNEVQVDEIRKLARDERQFLGFVGETPIANDIFTILDRLDIMLLEYPIESEDDRPAFSAAIMCSEEDDKILTFIGLNTADFYDKQIFAIAHELYHYYTKSGTHLSRLEDEEYSLIEAKANRFAAEFLLPETVLESIVLGEFKTSSLEKIHHKTLLRFLARLHCTWWLPYRSLVRRLHEISVISSQQYAELYSVNERDLQGEYGKIGQAINKEIFLKLNQSTKNIGTSPKEIEIIIRNFEDNLIDEDKFAKTLSLFNRTPEEFGYEIKASQEDIDELDAFFGGEGDDEN
jgi:Zn-dependent peptidase ImmA (M78 family)